MLTADEYDAYGIETYQYVKGVAPRGSLRFVGKQGYVSDDDSGLRLAGRRYYFPPLGQWLTQDPKGHAAGLNLYA